MSTEDAGGLADPGRLRALRAAQLLDAVPEPAFERLTRLATRTVGAPVSLVTLVDGDRQYNYVSSNDALVPQGGNLPIAHSFCAVVVRRAAPFVTADILIDEVAEQHPGLRATTVRAYAGFPLTVAGGHTLGALSAADDQPRDWSEEQLETLQDIAAMVVDELELRSALRISELRREELERAAASIRTLHGALDAADAERLEGQQAALRVAADLSHELRTPLYAIRMLAEDMTADAPPALHRGLGQIDETTAGALAVIDHHLELARATSGQGVVRLHEVPIPKLFDSLRGMLEPLARRPAVTLRFEHADELPPMMTDGVKLAQILRNLTTNALRHTTSGEVVVSAESGPEDTVLFGVRDTGRGIAPEDHERIFGRGAQVGEERNDGVGLGLPLARRMAEMIGGIITVESALGEGSSFTLRAPVTLVTTAPGVKLTPAGY